MTMKREKLDKRSAALLAEMEAVLADWQAVEELAASLPATKPTAEFTGKGFEIIGDPTGKSGGELHYRDGKCCGIRCASPPILTAKDAERRTPPPAKQVAWFILSRDRAKRQPPANADDPGQQSRELRDRHEACLFAQEITGLLLHGGFLAFSKKVERAVAAIKKEQREKDKLRRKEDGYRNALFTVAIQCSHPAELTVSAIADFLSDDSDFCKAYWINGTMKEQRGVRRGLKKIGFDWIPAGRGKGRPRKGNSAK
jgi:hypothetical protein